MAANHQSDETPSTSSSSSSFSIPRTSRSSSRTTTRNTAAYGGDEIDLDGFECSTGCCKSCVAGAIADGVAICCCPCAVLDLVAFVLIRVPWIVGRRCLTMARGKRNWKRKRKVAECGGGGDGGGSKSDGEQRRRSSGFSRNYFERWRVSEGMIEVTTSFKFEDDDVEDEGGDDRVWLELCRGFGRLSFTGIQSAGKCS